MVLAFSWQAVVGMNVPLLGLTTTIELFTDAVGTVIFVAYLSALCRNPLLHGDAIRAVDRAGGVRPQRALARHRLCRAHDRMGLVFRHLRAGRPAGPCHARLAAAPRAFRRIIAGQEVIPRAHRGAGCSHKPSQQWAMAAPPQSGQGMKSAASSRAAVGPGSGSAGRRIKPGPLGPAAGLAKHGACLNVGCNSSRCHRQIVRFSQPSQCLRRCPQKSLFVRIGSL